jgi:hypothetical protein
MAFTIKVDGYEVTGDDKEEVMAIAIALRERSGTPRAQETASRNGGNIEITHPEIADAVSRLPQKVKDVLRALVNLNGSASSDEFQKEVGEPNPHSFGIRLKVFNKAARQIGVFDPHRMIEKLVTGRDPRITTYSLREEWADAVKRGLEM